MSMNETPLSERVHIGIFGARNAGKSSLINALTNQDMAVVSDIKGTTTDPVYKAMEILPLGPCVIIDTPGTDDDSALGVQRVKKAEQVLDKTDIAVVVINGVEKTENDIDLISRVKSKDIPFITVYNKCDTFESDKPVSGKNEICVSAKYKTNIEELRDLICSASPNGTNRKKLVSDLINKGDICVLVIPVDESAPKGRLILPQQQVIRDILDSGGIAIACKDTEYSATLKNLSLKPRLVITDSRVFAFVSANTPNDLMLTSFSILFARYKGNLEKAVKGAFSIDTLKDGDRVLISEGCTHRRQCDDIGTVKIPEWLLKYTGKKLEFEFSQGGSFPVDLSGVALIIHCGGCMLNETEVKNRAGKADSAGIPFTNYGTVIAHINGILAKSTEPFGI